MSFLLKQEANLILLFAAGLSVVKQSPRPIMGSCKLWITFERGKPKRDPSCGWGRGEMKSHWMYNIVPFTFQLLLQLLHSLKELIYNWKNFKFHSLEKKKQQKKRENKTTKHFPLSASVCIDRRRGSLCPHQFCSTG